MGRHKVQPVLAIYAKMKHRAELSGKMGRIVGIESYRNLAWRMLWMLSVCALALPSVSRANAPMSAAQSDALHAELHLEPSDAELASMIPNLPLRKSKAGYDHADDWPEKSRTVSLGQTTRGVLRHGIRLEDSEVLTVKRGSRTTRHGTYELVKLIEHAAEQVADAYPGSELTAGDLSRPRGGRFAPHRSHRTGRDVDIGFYLKNSKGRRVHIHRFVKMSRRGAGKVAGRLYYFDTARNWEMIAALLSHPHVDVQHIFVANYLRARLIRYARKVKAPKILLEKAKRVVHQPTRGAPHRGHFHVRIFCPADDVPRCRDVAPFYAWHARPERKAKGKSKAKGHLASRK